MLLRELHLKDPKEVIEECKPFLEAIKGANELPWHGTHDYPTDYAVRTLNQDRRPRDTPNELDIAINDFFEQKFGWRARQQGIFITGNYRDAMAYGEPCILFPIGEFRSIWCPEVHDLMHTMDAIDYDLRKDVPDRVERRRKVLANTEGNIKAMDWYYNKELPKGLDMRLEIIIGCKTFFLFRQGFFNEVLRPSLIKAGYISRYS